MSWENVDGKVNRFPAASNRGSVVDVLTSGGAESWERLTWMCCCEEMTSGGRGEKTLQLCALSHSSDALWFVVEQQPSCWISPYCKLHDKCAGEQGGSTTLFRTGGHSCLGRNDKQLWQCARSNTQKHKQAFSWNPPFDMIFCLLRCSVSFCPSSSSPNPAGQTLQSVLQLYKTACNLTSVSMTSYGCLQTSRKCIRA